MIKGGKNGRCSPPPQGKNTEEQKKGDPRSIALRQKNSQHQKKNKRETKGDAPYKGREKKKDFISFLQGKPRKKKRLSFPFLPRFFFGLP